MSTGKMLSECLKYFSNLSIDLNSKNYGKVESKNLFKDLQAWLESRNDICHGFVKSEPGTPTKEIGEFHKVAIQAAKDGFILTKLVSKWHKQQLQLTNKKK